jgi:NRPS condensation-like uncharacterized protein
MDLKTVTQEFTKKKVTYDPFAIGPLSMAVPTTEVQREIWASIVMDENATLCYNESAAITFEGNLRPEILTKAFNELEKKHDSLRMIFSSDCKSFFIKEFFPHPLPFIDFSAKSPDDIETALEELKSNEVQFKFDLINGPCHRTILIKKSSEQYVLIFTAHHIVCDGWSIGVLFKELSD